MRAFVLALLCACGGTDTPPTKPAASTSQVEYKRRDAGIARLIAATQKHDAVALAQMFDGPVGFGGARFEDTSCTKQFSAAGTIPQASTAELARCLAQLPFASARMSAHPDIALLSYAPGIELEVLFAGKVEAPTIKWIGYVSFVTPADAIPTVTQEAFEAHRIEPQRIVLDAATQNRVDAELAGVGVTNRAPFAWIKVCVDAHGNVVRVQSRFTSSLIAQPVFEEAIRTWKLRPFQLGPQPAPICSLLRVGTAAPDGESRVPIPIPAAHIATQHVMPTLCEARRTAGKKDIFPDDLDKQRILDSATRALVGIFHYCIDATGSAGAVSLVRSTGVPGYDAKIMKAIGDWRYKPFERDGAPIPVCTFVSFVFSMKENVRVIRR